MKKKLIICMFAFIVMFYSSSIDATVDVIKKENTEIVNEKEDIQNTNDIYRKPRMVRSVGTININSMEDWITFSKMSYSTNNSVININTNLDFKDNTTYENLYINKGVIINGNNYTFSNINASVFILRNFGEINNLNFVDVKLKGSYGTSIVRENYGYMNNLNFNNISLKGTTYVGVVAKNYGHIKNTRYNKIDLVGESYVGSIAGLSSSVVSATNTANIVTKDSLIENATLNNIYIRSTLYDAKKAYRSISISGSKDASGDYFGGAIGINHNSLVKSVRIDNVIIRGDDFIGGLIGRNSYRNEGRKQQTIVSNVIVNNTNIYGGVRIGGIVGYNISYDPISLSKIAYNKTYHNQIMTVVKDSKVIGKLYLNVLSEGAGAAGINFSAKMYNISVSAIRQKYNIYSAYDEAAGFVGDNEFGYINKASSNINVYSKVFQAAGFCADNEGTIISSIATGNVYSSKEAGGFVGSNLGHVHNSKSYGHVYSTTSIKRTAYKKVKYKKKVVSRKNGFKKTSYKIAYRNKKISVYYPYYSANFSAYNGKQTYKGLRISGKVTSSKYYGKRYLKNKRISNRAYGAYGR